MKILVRLPNWLGDLVMATAFIKELRKLEPTANIDVIVKEELIDIAYMIEGINFIYPFSKKNYKGISGAIRFGHSIKKQTKYNMYFCLPNSFSSAAMGFATCAKKRVGFTKEFRTIWLNHAYSLPKTGHRVNRYTSLLERYYKTKLTDLKVELATASAKPEGAQPDKKTIFLNYNSEAVSRRMPLSKAVSITTALINNIDANFVMIGSPKEILIVNSIQELLPNPDKVINLAGKSSLKELAQLIKGADLVISTDSGPGHLANALGVPVISYFGAGDETETAPYNKTNSTILKVEGLACIPCGKNTCKLYGIPECLLQMDEMEIVEEVKRLLNS